MLIWRAVLSAIRLATFERKPERATAWPPHFDNAEGIIPTQYRKPFYSAGDTGELIAWKGRASPVGTDERVGLCAHITACHFGTSRGRRATWRKRIVAGEVPPIALVRYDGLDDVEQVDTTDAEFVARVAERIAYHERFWKVPYYCTGLRNGDVLINNPPSRYTYHGNGSNRQYLGVAAELKAGEPLDDFAIETHRAALRIAAEFARREGYTVDELTVHRAWSGSRREDPGANYWREVAKPMAGELRLAIDYHRSHGSGRPIPSTWDPSALFDERGRRIV